MLNDSSLDSSPKMIRHTICVEFSTKIKCQEIYEAIPHKTRNKYSDWLKNVPAPF